MKAIIAIFLSSYILITGLIPGSAYNELVRIPFLVKHFQNHLGTTPEITFLDFIKDHYSEKDHQDRKHEQLPFQDKTVQYTTVVISFSPETSKLIFPEFKLDQKPVSKDDIYTYLFTSFLFKPPKC